MMRRINDLYKFKNSALLDMAITHPSYANHYELDSYQRLEFLGDAIFNMIIATKLYETISGDEGELSRCKSFLTSEKSIYRLAMYLHLDEIVLTKGEVSKKKIVVDVFEAIVAAIFLDSNFKTVKKIVLNLISNLDTNFWDCEINYKTVLQEFTVKKHKQYPEYRSIKLKNGNFRVSLYIGDKLYGSVENRSKKQATMILAEKVFKDVNN